MTRAEQAYPSKSELSYVWSYGNAAMTGRSPFPSHAPKAANAGLSGHGTLQQTWEGVLPPKRRAGGARSQGH